MTTALKNDDLNLWARADERFHRLLVGMAGTETVNQIVQHCWDRSHRARTVTLRLRPLPIDSTQEHNAIVAAIAAGNPELTSQLYRAHRQRASLELLAFSKNPGLAECDDHRSRHPTGLKHP